MQYLKASEGNVVKFPSIWQVVNCVFLKQLSFIVLILFDENSDNNVSLNAFAPIDSILFKLPNYFCIP